MGGPFGFYMVSMVLMVVFMAVTWVLTSYMKLSGPVEIVVRTLFMALAMSAFGAVMYFRQRREQRKQEQAQGGAPGATTADKEIEVVIRDAQMRLAQSSVGRDAKLVHLPLFFIAGESGAAKTSTFIHSAVEPDLLAGQVYQDSAVTPTRPVNVWLAQK